MAESNEVQDWAEKNFNAVKKRIESLQDELRGNKPQENIEVRKVEASEQNDLDSDQIVVEYSVERWYSVNYFKKMLGLDQDSGDNFSTDRDDPDDNKVVF